MHRKCLVPGSARVHILTAFSTLFGSVFLHLAVDSLFPDVRRSTLAMLCRQIAKYPELMNHLISAAMITRLTQEKIDHSKDKPNTEDHETTDKKIESRLCAVYLSCGAFGNDLTEARREPLLVNLVVLGHHPTIGVYSLRDCLAFM